MSAQSCRQMGKGRRGPAAYSTAAGRPLQMGLDRSGDGQVMHAMRHPCTLVAPGRQPLNAAGHGWRPATPRAQLTSSTRPPTWSSPIVISAAQPSRATEGGYAGRPSGTAGTLTTAQTPSPGKQLPVAKLAPAGSAGAGATATATPADRHSRTTAGAARLPVRTECSPVVHCRLHDAGADEVCCLAAFRQHLLLLLRVRHAAGLLKVWEFIHRAQGLQAQAGPEGCRCWGCQVAGKAGMQ